MRKLSLLHLLLIASILLLLVFFLPNIFKKNSEQPQEPEFSYLEKTFLESYLQISTPGHDINKQNAVSLLKQANYKELFSQIITACNTRDSSESKLKSIQKAYEDLVNLVISKDMPTVDMIRKEQKALENPQYNYDDLVYLNACVTLRI